MLKLRINGGTKVLFVADTGAAATMFDKSLESELGRSIDTGTVWHYGVTNKVGVYPAPTLYAGNTPLKTAGAAVACFDFTNLLNFAVPSGPAFKGVLGMDVLGHYCIQLDFDRGKVRFLDARADKSDWGTPFPLLEVGDGCFAIGANLAGLHDSVNPTNAGYASLIDTGCSDDGWLRPYLYRVWTNQAVPPPPGEARSPDGILGAETYPEIDLSELEQKAADSDDSHMRFNGIGLHFLSRHLVTLDFPERTMYLKRTSKWGLRDAATMKELTSTGNSAIAYLHRLKKKGLLPGWTKNDRVEGNSMDFHFQPPNRGVFDARKAGSPDIYHVEVMRTSNRAAWTLKRAWQTDEKGRLLKEFPVP